MKANERNAIRAAQAAVRAEISGNASRGGQYAGAMSGEGYAGGYSQALSDVMLLLESHCLPNTRNYWSAHATLAFRGFTGDKK